MQPLKIFFLFSLWVCAVFSVQGQHFIGKRFPLPLDQAAEASSSPDTFYTLDLRHLYAYLSSLAEGQPAPLRLQWGEQVWEMEVWPEEIRHPSYRMVLSEEKGQSQLSDSKSVTLLGRVHGSPETTVALTVAPAFLFGQVGDYLVEPARFFRPSAPADALIIYRQADWPAAGPALCGDGGGEPEKADPYHGNEPGEDLRSPAGDQPDRSGLLPDRSGQPWSFPALEKNGSAGSCFTAEIALAADYLLFQEFGDPFLVENYLLALLNLVRLNYDDEFADEIRFAVKGIFVSTCADCDPWTPDTNSNFLLSGFRDWGNAGGFGFTYDLASLWTSRVLDGNMAGLGYFGAVCENNRYNIMRKYTNNAGLLRTLQAHEIGHNFDARHDSKDSLSIMAPAIINIDHWTAVSVNRINTYVNGLATGMVGCLEGCQAPEAVFTRPQAGGCAPLLVQFADSSRGEITEWHWYFSGGFPAESVLPNPVVEYTAPGAYGARLVVRNASGESEFLLDSVVLVQALSPQAGFSYSVDQAQLSVRFTNNSTGGERFSWLFGDETQSNEPEPVHQYPGSGSYPVTLIAENGCGADTIEQVLVVQEILTAAFDSSGQRVGCGPLTVRFSDQSVGNVTSRQWSFPGGQPAASTSRNPTVVYHQAGEFNVTLSVSSAFSSDTEVKNSYVRVFPGPDAQFSVGNTLGDTLIQFTNLSRQANDFAWSFGDGATSTEPEPNHYYPADGQFTVQLIAFNECGADTTAQELQILRPPVANAAMEPQIGCAPLEVRFLDLSQGTITERRWTFPGGSPSQSSEANPLVRYPRQGAYDVQLMVGNPAGEDSVQYQGAVQVGQGITAKFRADISPAESKVNFRNQSQGAVAYEWDFGDGWASTERNPFHIYQTEGTYEVELIAISSCGRDTVRQTIEILRAPQAAFDILSESGCLPRVVQFTDLSAGQVTEREWIFSGGQPAISTLRDPVVAYSTPGIYSVQLIVRNAAGETMLVKEDLVTVDEKTVARFDYQYTLGENQVQFRNFSVGASSFLWDFGDGTVANERDPLHIFPNDGQYTVRLEAQGCSNSLMVEQLTIAILPVVAFSSRLTEGCAPLEVNFENKSTGNNLNFAWEFPGGHPNTSFEEHPTVEYPNPGVYDVRLRVSNSAGEVLLEQLSYIQAKPGPEAAFTFAQEGSAVRFFNQSRDVAVYHWDFGDGQSADQAEPAHEYQTAGDYTVQLIGTNACGADTTTQLLSVIINDIDILDGWSGLRVYPNPNPGLFYLQPGLLSGRWADLEIYNSLGQTVYRKRSVSLTPDPYAVQMGNPPPGIYFLELRVEGKTALWKMVIE